jgi:hypothetical protein
MLLRGQSCQRTEEECEVPLQGQMMSGTQRAAVPDLLGALLFLAMAGWGLYVMRGDPLPSELLALWGGTGIALILTPVISMAWRQYLVGPDSAARRHLAHTAIIQCWGIVLWGIGLGTSFAPWTSHGTRARAFVLATCGCIVFAVILVLHGALGWRLGGDASRNGYSGDTDRNRQGQ